MLRAALVIERAEDVERLPLDGAARWLSLTIVAMPRWMPISSACAPLSGGTTPERILATAGAGAARVAREAAHALPGGIAARHVAYERWGAPAFIEALRQGAFDTALFAAWPPWTQRMAVARAARAGGVEIVRVTRPSREPSMAGARTRVSAPA